MSPRQALARLGPHSLDGFHPLLLLLWARGGDPVHHMVPLHYSAIRLCFAGLDDLPFVTGIVKLKAVLVERRERLSWGCQARLSAIRLLSWGAPAPWVERNWHKKATYRLPRVLHLPDAEVFQWDDAPGLLVLQEKGARQPQQATGEGPSQDWMEEERAPHLLSCIQSSRGSYLSG